MATPKQSEYLITDNRQIATLCGRIVSSRKPITIYFNQSRESFGSLLFDVNANGNSCFLDALIPATGNQLLIDGKPASVQCNLDGITTWFGTGQIIGTGTSNGHSWLEMTLPKRAWYQQRRNAFRAQSVVALNLTVKLYSREREQPINATIQDLSVSGCRVAINQQPEPSIEANELFYRCQLLQGDEQVISCGAEVRHLEDGPHEESSEIGLSFTQLTPQHDAVLSQLVIKLEVGLSQSELMA